jgi:hypothetical protein
MIEDHESISDNITTANSPHDEHLPSSPSSTSSQRKLKPKERASEKDLIDLARTILK